VYTACQTPCKLTRLVTSLMSTGARRFDRSFLWVTRKLISAVLIVLSSGTGFVDISNSIRAAMLAGDRKSRTHWSRTLVLSGIPEMKATSFLLLVCLTPRCQSATYSGGANALELEDQTMSTVRSLLRPRVARPRTDQWRNSFE
jgi:hypothetical protein